MVLSSGLDEGLSFGLVGDLTSGLVGGLTSGLVGVLASGSGVEAASAAARWHFLPVTSAAGSGSCLPG